MTNQFKVVVSNGYSNHKLRSQYNAQHTYNLKKTITIEETRNHYVIGKTIRQKKQ
jgi:hypothetical protein